MKLCNNIHSTREYTLKIFELWRELEVGKKEGWMEDGKEKGR